MRSRSTSLPALRKTSSPTRRWSGRRTGRCRTNPLETVDVLYREMRLRQNIGLFDHVFPLDWDQHSGAECNRVLLLFFDSLVGRQFPHQYARGLGIIAGI